MTTQTVVEPSSNQLNSTAHLVAAWPLAISILGGVIGIALGLVAYFINLKIYSSDLTKVNKILGNLLCGMSIMSMWWFIAQWVQG